MVPLVLLSNDPASSDDNRRYAFDVDSGDVILGFRWSKALRSFLGFRFDDGVTAAAVIALRSEANRPRCCLCHGVLPTALKTTSGRLLAALFEVSPDPRGIGIAPREGLL